VTREVPAHERLEEERPVELDPDRADQRHQTRSTPSLDCHGNLPVSAREPVVDAVAADAVRLDESEVHAGKFGYTLR
jgi:hypothetical protein